MHQLDDIARGVSGGNLTRRETIVKLCAAVLTVSPLAGTLVRSASAGRSLRADACDDCFQQVRLSFDRYQKRRLLLPENDPLHLLRATMDLMRQSANAATQAVACAGSDSCIDPCAGCGYVCGTCPCVPGGVICCLYDDVDGRSPCCGTC